MYQINLNLISIKYFCLINIYILKTPHKFFALGSKLCWAAPKGQHPQVQPTLFVKAP